MEKFNVSSSFQPGNDFNLYVNDNWLQDNEIPSDYSRWGSFEVLNQNTQDKIKEILEIDYIHHYGVVNRDHKLISDMYHMGMDDENLNKEKNKPIIPYLEKIDQINDLTDLTVFLALVTRLQLKSPFYLGIYADKRNSDTNIIYLHQGGLGLPDRDYYFLPNKEKERKGYKNLVSNLFNLIQTDIDHDDIYNIEVDLANCSLTKTEQRDPHKTYNVYDINSLKELCPNIKWEIFFKELDIKPEKIVVDNPNFFTVINNILNKKCLDCFKNYLKSNFLRSVTGFLSDDFYNTSFDYYGKQLNGQEEPKPRWKRVLGLTEGLLGEIIGKIYIERHFPLNAKNKAKEMINFILMELENRIKKLDWMSETTKVKALEKLGTFTVKIGFPDKWRDYSKLELTGKSYFENILIVNKINFDHEAKKVYKKVDKSEWLMHPHQINAYYYPVYNEIVFPAAILQAPFFDVEADPALNFGGIGAVIGHEITHGFDDQGRKYDAEGNMNDWWTKEDEENYSEKAKIIEEQFNNSIVEGQNVNGKMTLGENIADIGGLSIAYYALLNYLGCHNDELIDGFTQQQRFFMSWARVWRANMRKEMILERLITDVHSPNTLRINNVVGNLDGFYDAFQLDENCKLGIASDKRGHVW